MFPDFLGIGTQKGATTWLHMVLQQHPKVWLPPTKEIHFFDDSFDEDSHFKRAVLKKEGYHKSVKRFKFTDLKNISWAYKFLFKKRNIDYYNNLFTPGEEQICGEISPNYARLTLDRIKRVKKYMPDTKLIYILRNPIDRDWSATCMYFNNKKMNPENLPIDEILQIAISDNKSSHSNYYQNLENWETNFSSDQIFIGFYDEIQKDPRGFLNRLFNFLSIENVVADMIDENINRKFNSHSISIPSEILLAIAKQEYKNIQNIHNRFNNQYTKTWLENANNILNHSTN